MKEQEGCSKWIKINSIIPGENCREEPGDLEGLIASIKKNGLLQPVIVKHIGDGKYDLIAGYRRFQACRELEWYEIPAVIRNDPDKDRLVLQLTENIQRLDLSPWETYLALNDMREEGLGITQIAARINKSRAWAQMRFDYGRIVNSLREYGASLSDIEKFSFTSIWYLNRLNKKDRFKMFNQMISGGSPELRATEIRKIVDMKNPPKKQKGPWGNERVSREDKDVFSVVDRGDGTLRLLFTSEEKYLQVLDYLKAHGGVVI
jgi:ParB/RepB/Spo0J family partition protein